MSNKFKTIIGSLLLLFASTLVLSACGNSESHTHQYDEWSVTRASTCTETGEEARFCSCGDTQTRTIPTKEHNYGDWTVTKIATCTVNGSKERSCACGEKETQTISASGHTFGTWNTTKEATCTVNGSKERSCVCGEKETQTISAAGHTFSAWNTTKEATCTVNGSKERTCSCGEKETETIIASHAWKDATCTEAKNCSKCGLTDGSALGHTCSIGTCTRCNIMLHPTVNLPSTPMTVWWYSYCTMKITELSYKFDSYGNLFISFSGEKTYGKDSQYIALNYKVLDEDGYVLQTGMWAEKGYNTGDKFKNETFEVYSSNLNGASEYTIVITDYN